MRFFLKYGLILIFFLTFSLSSFALNKIDDCTGNSSLQPKLKNVQAYKDIKNITQENIGAAGYYTLINRQERHGEIIYQVENAESLTVKTYSPLASFFTVNESGELIRGFSGPLNEKIRGRLFTNPSVDVILAPANPPIPLDGNVYYCTVGEFLYEFSRGRYGNPSHLQPYGLNIEASADGIQYHTVSGDFAAMQINGRGYLEEHQVKLSGEGPFIRLSLSCATTLKEESGVSKENHVERPINIISVQFDIHEKISPEETPSSSSSNEPKPSSSSNEPKPSSSSNEPKPSSSSSIPESKPSPSSDSDSENKPSPVVVRRKSSSSKQKNESYNSDDDPDIDEPNEVIHEPFSFTITNTHPPKEEAVSNNRNEFNDINDINTDESSDHSESEISSSSSTEELETSETTQKTTSEAEKIVSSENSETSQISPKFGQEMLFSSDDQKEDIPENGIDTFDKLFLGVYSIIVLFIVGEFGIRATKIYCQSKYQNPQDPEGRDDVNNSRSSKM